MKKESKLPVRNWVAKNQKTSGAGRHTDRKRDYQRHDKHRKPHQTTQLLCGFSFYYMIRGHL
jgi:hypothetical protein